MPGGILTVILRSREIASGAAARRARLGDDLAGALALRARARDREESLLKPDLSLAAALRTRGRRRSGGGAGSVAGLAGFLPRNLNRRLDALGRFLERDLEVVAKIGAALRTAAPAAAAEEIAEAEHVAEDVGEVAELVEDRRIETCASAAAERTP